MASELAERIRAALPKDGTTVGNISLIRKLETTPELYDDGTYANTSFAIPAYYQVGVGVFPGSTECTGYTGWHQELVPSFVDSTNMQFSVTEHSGCYN